ncbi:hypothetical protein ACR8AL_14300 [Clavibacter sepedonicus]|uniref:hypothetical protein n=1 Tax=Clavibacter TaxID=1573 RepID=UPI000D097256|nr:MULTISPECIES: hypothetical protein [Clavibacter]MBD5383116.1 hypothetical protein [Clavibacter sp.]
MLPINPTDDDIREWLMERADNLHRWDVVRAAHQAGVTAERARAAAEMTVEWGVQYEGAYGDEAGRIIERIMGMGDEGKRLADQWLKRGGVVSDPGDHIVRRVAAGPWEAQG